MAETQNHTIAYNWIDAIRRKTVKNMTHVEYIHKYSRVRQNIDELVLILTGLRFTTKEYFLIRIHGALYEPFSGPHYVQIGDQEPFWVHSLTAFRREFFGLTDKLSFERSVFVGLSNGEVIRLKIARPYLFMAHDVAIPSGARIKIMKTPTDSFMVSERDIVRHKADMHEKKRKAIDSNQAVRTRVRNHLVGSVQQLFCSYMRDTQITPDQAYQWFRTDMQHALSICDTIYTSFVRVRPQRDSIDMSPDMTLRPALMTSTIDIQATLLQHASRIDHTLSDISRIDHSQSPIQPGDMTNILGPRSLPLLPASAGADVLLQGIMEDTHNDCDEDSDESLLL